MTDRENLIAYLATLFAISILSLAAAAVCMAARVTTEVDLARIIGALAFISAAITGLIGVIGTFRGKSGTSAQADANLATALDKLPPATTGTGPAVPLEEGA
ncbi:MAG TPA: hypothetical protein VIO38_17315 [Rariglobus sp.]